MPENEAAAPQPYPRIVWPIDRRCSQNRPTSRRAATANQDASVRLAVAADRRQA